MLSGFHFWLALLGLHLLENMRITTGSAVVFYRRSFSGNWQARTPFSYPGGGRWGWILSSLSPLNPTTLVAQDFALAMNEEQFSPNAALSSSKSAAVPYNQIQSVCADESWVLVNGNRYLRCECRDAAEQFSRQIDEIRRLPAQKRTAAIESILDQAFKGGMSERLRLFRSSAQTVEILVAWLWMTAFVLLPFMLAATGSDAVLLPLLAGIWLLAAAIARASVKARQRIEGKKTPGFPWKSLKYALYPVAALRAYQDLAERVVNKTHPLALCTELCSDSQEPELAIELVLRIRYPRAGATNAEVNAVSEWFNARLEQRMTKHLNERRPDILKKLIPERLNEGCLSYCPRCRMQYRRADGICSDCPGVALKSFAFQA